MAVLTAQNATVVFQDGRADKVALIALRNVNTGDTLDLGASGINVMQFINRAVITSVFSFVEIAGAWSGTVVTMPSGLANDAAWLLVLGSGTG
jgi:hypothetical protein